MRFEIFSIFVGIFAVYPLVPLDKKCLATFLPTVSYGLVSTKTRKTTDEGEGSLLLVSKIAFGWKLKSTN